MRLLVIGGAGYVGSHGVRVLEGAGHEVWVYDNLSRGHRSAARADRLIVGSLHDQPLLESVLRDRQIDAVLHYAAFALVGESVGNPAMYYHNNVIGSYHLLEAMRASGVQNLIFSSTTAIFGEPEKTPIAEHFPKQPINPYGFTKLVMERMLDDYAQAYGMSFVALRYFNAAGAHPSGEIGEDHTPESHLIPIVLQVALGQREKITIYGNDYPTLDGTCIRDYIHVDDLADAHLLALDHFAPGKGLKLNLGTGRGHSVKEVIDCCRAVTGHPIPAEVGERRPGDPSALVADPTLAKKTLGWQPRYNTLLPIVETAWNWHQKHPHGYGD